MSTPADDFTPQLIALEAGALLLQRDLAERLTAVTNRFKSGDEALLDLAIACSHALHQAILMAQELRRRDQEPERRAPV